jgi:hypothetical protein
VGARASHLVDLLADREAIEVLLDQEGGDPLRVDSGAVLA